MRTQSDGWALLDATQFALRWDPNETELWMTMAMLLSASGNPDAAGVAFVRALRVNPVRRAQAVAATAQGHYISGGKEQ